MRMEWESIGTSKQRNDLPEIAVLLRVMVTL